MPAHRACLVLPLRFPHGLAPGRGRIGNRLELTLAPDGAPLLRGTALAGVLRHAYHRRHGRAAAQQLFGTACDARPGRLASGQTSRVSVADHRLRLPEGGAPLLRTHNAIDRRRGAVLDGRLYALEALPPGTACTAVLWISADDAATARRWSEQLAALVAEGLTVGAAAARGIGWMELAGDPRWRCFDRARDLVEELEAHRRWRSNPDQLGNDWPPNATRLELPPADGADRALLRLELAIPPGQDLLIAADRDGRPQRVRIGKDWYWRLPGASLRGVLRDWCIRLARRGEPPLPAGLDPEQAIAELFGFVQDTRNERAGVNDLELPTGQRPLMRAGRLHISDGLAKARLDADAAMGQCSQPAHDVQYRLHVAVDRVSGGASDAALFDNQVLVSPVGGSTAFPLTIRIRAPRPHELAWLARALTALHVGVLRLGSSKAAGRVSVRIAELALDPEARTAFLEHLAPELRP